MTKSSEFLAELNKRELMVMEKLLQIRETRLRFAMDHHVNTRGERMEFDTFPHIRDLYSSLAPVIVLQGSVQSLKSEWAIVDHFSCAYVGLSVFFVVSKYEARTTYVQNRVNRCVENVDEYKNIIGNGFFDNVALKSFGKGVIKYVGSNVLADFKEFPADVIVVEEVDECDQDNVEYALDRLRASRYQFKRYIGNPKITGRGISKFFLQTDQREWNVPCKACGEYSESDWFNTVVQDVTDKDGNITSYRLRDKDWVEGCMRDIKMICPKCKTGELDRTSVKGQWVATNPGATIEGYHISMLCSPMNSIAGMWVRFLEALNDPLRLQQFYNSELGLPYQAAGNKVTETLLDRCVDKEYMFEIEGGTYAQVKENGHPGPCCMGIDVGGNFDIQIAHSVEDRRHVVYLGKIKNIDDIHDLIARYNVEVCVMDSMPETNMAEEFQRNAKCDVWLCRYGSEGNDRRMSYDPSNRVVTVDRTAALDRSFARIKKGKVKLPANYPSILKGEFSEEMCGPVRQIVEDNKGNSRYEWSKCKDHQRHADCYSNIACDLMKEAILDDITVG